MPDNETPQDPENTADKILQDKETTGKPEEEDYRDKSEEEESTDKPAADDEQHNVLGDLMISDVANVSPASSVFGNEPQEVHQQFIITGNQLDLLLDAIEELEIFNIPLPMDNFAGNYETILLNELDLLISSLIEFDQLAVADAVYMENPHHQSCSHGPPQCISTTMRRHTGQHRPYSGHAMNLCNASSPSVVGGPMAEQLTGALQELGVDMPLQRIIAANRHPLSCPFNADANSAPARLGKQPNPKYCKDNLFTNVVTGNASVKKPIIPTEARHGTPSDDGDEVDDYEVTAPEDK